MLKSFKLYSKINESISKKSSYWENKGKSKDKVALYTHDDMDGLFSAIVMKGWLEENGFTIYKYGIVNYQEGFSKIKLSPDCINIVVDYSEYVDGVDVFIDHHGNFEDVEDILKIQDEDLRKTKLEDLRKSNPKPGAVKTSTGSAYEGICINLGIPVDDTVLSVIDMIDAAKYDEYDVDIKGILTFDLKKFKNKLEFAASFNQLLKRSDYKTLIEVIANHKSTQPSIYKIFSLMKKFYVQNNIDRKSFKYDYKLNWKDVDDKIRELLEENPLKLRMYMQDFVESRKKIIDTMVNKTRGFDKNKKYYKSQEEFLNDFGYIKQLKSEKKVKIINCENYQFIGNMVYVPSGTWSNALRIRSIIEKDYENNNLLPTIKYMIDKNSPLYSELLELNNQKVELIGEIVNIENQQLIKKFIPYENVTNTKNKEGITGTIKITNGNIDFYAKPPIFWVFLQYGDTLQIASYHDVEKYDKKYLPKTKDGKIIDNLGEYTNTLLKNLEEQLGYNPNQNEGQTTKSGGHPGIGTISNIFGTIESDKFPKFNGTPYIDFIKNKIINDLSGINWSDLSVLWSDPESQSFSFTKENPMDHMTLLASNIRKIDEI